MEDLNKKEIHDIFIRIKNDNKTGIEELYAKYQKLIINISFSIVKDRNIAEEISQTIFLKIMQMSKENIPSNNELSWLYTITKNQTIDYLRKQHDNVDIDEIYDVTDKDNDINEIIDIDTYKKIIECLEENEREIVSLKVLSNFTFKEIGSILNIPTATVQWKYYKSVHTLKILLSNMSLFIIATILYVKSKESSEKEINSKKHNEDKISSELTKPAESIGITTADSSLSVNRKLKVSSNTILLSLSTIFLIFTIIFSIIFAKHQQKRHRKTSKYK